MLGLNWQRQSGIFVLYPRLNLVGCIINISPEREAKYRRDVIPTFFPFGWRSINQVMYLICVLNPTQVPITESILLRIATTMSMMKYEFEQYKDCKFDIHLVPSELLAKQHSQYGHLRPARSALFCR